MIESLVTGRAVMPRPLFAVGQEFIATRNRDNVPVGSRRRNKSVAGPCPKEFEYTVEFDEGRTAILVESAIKVLSNSNA